MGALFLDWLADELRAAGLTVTEFNGWQRRARGSGGYTTRPVCVMEHHTASPASWDGSKDATYIATGSSVAPLANLYIDRSGRVWVIAAGATNTNGAGVSLKFSHGTVPANSMNLWAVGIECGNDGVGESWPRVQVDALIASANVVNRRLGNVAADVAGHVHYSPGRKIDPATAAAVQGPWKPRAINSSGSWNLDDMRAVHQQRWALPPAPESEENVSGSSSLWLGAGRLDNFMVGKDGHTYHNWYDAEAKRYTAIEDLGGVLDGSVSATGQGDDGVPVRIDLTGKGVDSPPGLWHKWYEGGKWNDWERISDWPGPA